MKVLLWEVREVWLWHHVALLLTLHDQVVCSLLGKTMVLVISTTSVGLSLRVVGGRMLLIWCLGFDLSIGKVHMVLRRGHLRQIMVHLDVRRHSRRLAHRLRLRIPWELSDLESGELLLPALRRSAYAPHEKA